MTKRSWIRNRSMRPARRRTRKAPPWARLTVEELEDRRLLATFTVSNTLDDGSVGSLRWAIGQANTTAGADTVDFAQPLFSTTQTITLNGTQLTLSDTTGATTITGPDAGVTVNGNNASRVFQVDEMVAASISGMTITGGNSNPDPGFDYEFGGGGLRNNGGTVTLNNCTVSGNSTGYGYGYGGGGGLLSNGGTMALNNCTVSGNSTPYGSGGGLYNDGGAVTLNNSTVSGNSAPYLGGGLANGYGGGTMTLNNSTVSGNSAGSGGGVWINAGTLAMTDCTVSDNTASFSSGGGVGSNDFLRSTMTLTNSTVSGNTATRKGGGVHNGAGSTATLTNSTVSGNIVTNNSGYGGGLDNQGDLTLADSIVSGNSAGAGGGVRSSSRGTVTLTNSTVRDNTARFHGGGLRNEGLAMTLSNSTVSGNSAGRTGGGLSNGQIGTLSLTNSTVSGNSAVQNGGGLYNYAGNVTLTGSTVSGNSAGGDGGGLSNFARSPRGDILIEDSLISDNLASGRGGGIRSEWRGSTSTSITFRNTTISGNEARGGKGGGVSIDGFGTTSVSFEFSTIARNRAPAEGGGGLHSSLDAHLDSVIVADNTALVDPDVASDPGATLTVEYSLIETPGGATISDVVGNVFGMDPLLGPLENNGGPTATHALLGGSPAVDSGNPATFPAADQRGVSRPQGGIADMGAYERRLVELIGGDLFVFGTFESNRISLTMSNSGGVFVSFDASRFGPYELEAAATMLVFAGAGDDVVTVSGNAPYPVELHGEEGDDYLAGGSQDDLLVGGPGNDRLLAGEGDNVLIGDDVAGETATDGDDYLASRNGADVLLGGGGRDVLISGGGNDVLDGGTGDDQLSGGFGDDILVGGAGNDMLQGYYGQDVLLGGSGNDRLLGGYGNDLLVGGAGGDQLRGDYDDDTLVAGTSDLDDNSFNPLADTDPFTPNAQGQALLALLADWVGSNDDSALGTLTDDGDVDLLYDVLGTNLAKATGTGDRIYGSII